MNNRYLIESLSYFTEKQKEKNKSKEYALAGLKGATAGALVGGALHKAAKAGMLGRLGKGAALGAGVGLSVKAAHDYLKNKKK